MSGPSARAPKTLYWLDVTTIGKLTYRQKGGGKFTDRPSAERRRRVLAQQGIDTVLYESEPIQWKEVPSE